MFGQSCFYSEKKKPQHLSKYIDRNALKTIYVRGETDKFPVSLISLFFPKQMFSFKKIQSRLLAKFFLVHF